MHLRHRPIDQVNLLGSGGMKRIRTVGLLLQAVTFRANQVRERHLHLAGQAIVSAQAGRQYYLQQQIQGLIQGILLAISIPAGNFLIFLWNHP